MSDHPDFTRDVRAAHQRFGNVPLVILRTDKGRTMFPRSWPNAVGKWFAAMEQGLALANYSYPWHGSTIEDKAPTDRETLGMTLREYRALCDA